MAGTTKKTTKKTPNGNSASLLNTVAKKLGGGAYANSPDTRMNADEYITRARKAGKSDAEIAKMTKAQLMKL